MTTEKFEGEVATLKRFFEFYCSGNHKNGSLQKISTIYENKKYNFEFHLCDDCFRTLGYSVSRLQECPHHLKPKCRTCKTPCYAKQEWKETAKVMKYSGMRLGLLKIKNILRKN